MTSTWPTYTGPHPWADEFADLQAPDPGPLTKGVPDPERPDHWLVTPWPEGASYSTLVGHFLQWLPSSGEWANSQLMLRYYKPSKLL